LYKILLVYVDSHTNCTHTQLHSHPNIALTRSTHTQSRVLIIWGFSRTAILRFVSYATAIEGIYYLKLGMSHQPCVLAKFSLCVQYTVVSCAKEGFSSVSAVRVFPNNALHISMYVQCTYISVQQF
jgi:hypothetical protein